MGAAIIQTSALLIQETPTKELGDHAYGSSSPAPEFSGAAPSASCLNRFANSESSTDEEGKYPDWGSSLGYLPES